MVITPLFVRTVFEAQIVRVPLPLLSESLLSTSGRGDTALLVMSVKIMIPDLDVSVREPPVLIFPVVLLRVRSPAEETRQSDANAIVPVESEELEFSMSPSSIRSPVYVYMSVPEEMPLSDNAFNDEKVDAGVEKEIEALSRVARRVTTSTRYWELA